MKKNILSMFMAILMLLTIIIPTTTTAAAVDDGIVLYSEACRYCEFGVICTTTTKKRTGSGPVRYSEEHVVNKQLYSCPIWTAEEHIRVACDKCDTEYSAETKYGECIVHECGQSIKYNF